MPVNSELHPSPVSQLRSSASPIPKRARLRRYRFFNIFLALLALLTLFVALRGDDRPQAVVQAKKVPTVHVITGPTGPFVAPPLSTDQIAALRHMSSLVSYKKIAQEYVAHMTLDEELGQLFMAEYYDTSYSPGLDTMVNKLHAGGVIMYAFQMNTLQQTKHDISEMQQHAQIPLLISSDEEGGYVERIQNIFGDRPGALQTYQTGNPQKAAQLGHSIARDLLKLGINEDLAPDVDVQLVDGPDQYLRTWGYTPASVITYGGAYLRAIQSDGVVGCLKHFPGLGAAKTDAHFDLPVVNRTKDQIYATELAPFKAFIQSHQQLEQPGMIMPTDILMPAIDPKWPAELSHTFMTDILRKQLGYDGVAITDALYMKGIANHWSLPQAAVLALNAGNDMLLGANGPYQMQAMLDGLKAALADGTLSKARVDEAATRILTLKLQRHIMPQETPQYYGLTH
ncbi:MAG: glycoside hydrolase family 3 [Chloroflexota bacterium]|nr:glycoside hydrolase family 3 [Chloroflexota bacterium]